MQSPDVGGFSVVFIQFKVFSLLALWVKRLLLSSSGWTYLLKYWLLDRFQATPLDVLSSVDDFVATRLSPFYSRFSRLGALLRVLWLHLI